MAIVEVVSILITDVAAKHSDESNVDFVNSIDDYDNNNDNNDDSDQRKNIKYFYLDKNKRN